MNNRPSLTRKLSYAPGEHLLSAWVRYNLRAGFSYISFDRCLKYWNLPKQHLKPQRVNDNVQRSIINLTTKDKDSFQSVILDRTVSNLWLLSLPNIEAIEKYSSPRANLENNVFAYTTGWKFCSLCVNADRKKYGYSYWHRDHQLPSITHCVVHNCLLETSDALRHLSTLNLPAMAAGKKIFVALDHQELKIWSNFVLTVDSLMAENQGIVVHWKKQIAKIIQVNEKATSRKKTIYKDYQTHLENQVSSTILTHLFKSYHEGYTRRVNMLWGVLSGDSKANDVSHPIYWLVIMFWLREKLLHLDDVDYACL